MDTRYRFCHHCGTQYATLDWPRICINETCQREHYNNPLPVVICVQPVWDEWNERMGLAIAQRAIPPHIGGWTLIAGHVENNGENLRGAAAREFLEETSVIMGDNRRIIDDYANGKGHILTVVEASPIMLTDFGKGNPCRENLALSVMWSPRDLAFPIHTDVATKWFNR